MPVPDSVQRQIEAGKVAFKEAYGRDMDEPVSLAVHNQTSGDTPPAETPPAETPPAETAQPTNEAETQTGETETPPAQVPADKAENWEHKFKTLQGMYAASQQKNQKETGELRQQIASLNLLVKQLKSQPAAPTPQPQKQRLLKDEEIKDYGEDMIDVVKRAASEEILPELTQLRQDNAQLRELVEGVTGQFTISSQEQMYSRLTAELPEWSQINTDPEFIEWLQQSDPFSGQQRHGMLQNAVEQADASRVLAFFKGYLDQTAAVSHQAQPDTGAPQRRPQVQLDSLVAPGRPKSTTGQGAQQSNGKRIWHSGDINQFYADIRRGAYRDRPADRARIEQDIVAAAQEGRIR